MATFKHPFNASNQGALILKILKGKYDPIPNREYSSDLKKMVDLLLEKNHFKRPSVLEIIKNPFFINKAKCLNITDPLLDHIITSSNVDQAEIKNKKAEIQSKNIFIYH
jgi:NIMA (never in mitosis gene a)-related kinase